MPRRKQLATSRGSLSWVGVFLAAGLLLGSTAFLWSILAENKKSDGISPTALYAIQFRNLDGQSIALGQWQNKILLINFWATWCAPCRQEIPHLIEAQRRYAADKVQIIGIAIDKADKIRPFSSEIGMNYPILIDEEKGIALSKRLGNHTGVLPFTAVIDKQGHTVSGIAGVLSEKQLQEQIQRLI